MTSILILGAGKSSVYLIEFLIKQAEQFDWKIIVADYDVAAARTKTGDSIYAEAIFLDIHNTASRQQLVSSATIVISLLPPALHYIAATDCIAFRKHLFTASYIDDNMRALQKEIESMGLLFLCELGLDPGLDHMSAMQLISDIQASRGNITSFKSHCGGLVAPENDDNPWHYKISWNPRNVVLAGMAGGRFKANGEIVQVPYQSLFVPENTVDIPNLGELCWYANRDSLPYMDLYRLDNCHSFLRTTLRYPEFCLGWKTIIELGLTNQSADYETDNMSLQQFFKLHFSRYGFAEWVENNLTNDFRSTTDLLQKIEKLITLDGEPAEHVQADLKKFMLIDESGKLNSVGIEEIKLMAADTVARKKHIASLIIQQLLFLGINDNQTIINKGKCSAADVLQFALEQKLVLHPTDRDMVVMLHEIEYERDGKIYLGKSSLIVKGDDAIHTAMAKTVGLPLAIAASLFLQGKLKISGLLIPVTREIFEPVLHELRTNGIFFTEIHSEKE